MLVILKLWFTKDNVIRNKAKIESRGISFSLLITTLSNKSSKLIVLYLSLFAAAKSDPLKETSFEIN